MLSILPINLVCYKVDRFLFLKASNLMSQTARLEEEPKDF